MINKKFYYCIISVVIILSFRFFSSNFYAILNSDDAVSILMLHYFSLPHDFYFWGQDRYGSLIPLLGQLFFKGFNLSALTSESITHYIILIIGFFGFASMFKSYLSKILFAIIWFFPPMVMVDLIRFNLGTQYSLISISILVINKLYNEKFDATKLRHHLSLLFITIALILSIWVSDLSALTVLILLSIQLFLYLRKYQFKLEKTFFKKPELYYFFLGLISAVIFIHYAKSSSDKEANYALLNDFSTTFKALKIFGRMIYDFLIFKIRQPFTSAYLYLVLIGVAIVLFRILNKSNIKNNKRWILFFTLDGFLVFCIIILSKWSYMNHVPTRYFVPVYITFWMAFLLTIESMSNNEIFKKKLHIYLLITVLLGGIGTLYNIKYIWPRTLKPRIEIARELKTLGTIGIVGDYWNTYINSCIDPETIKVIPYENAGKVLHTDFIDTVFHQPNIYVIKDNWLKTFPDTLYQYGYVLLKDGKEFFLADSYICKYKTIK